MRSALERVREEPQSTKARILAAAEEVFAAKGFAGASTREIADKAGVNISSLHYHWESKETLYFAVFQDVYDRIVAVIRSALEQQKPGKDRGRTIETVMGTLFDFFADHPTIPRLLVRRLVENDEGHADIENRVLVPAWKVFAEWTRAYGGVRRSELEANLFMLTVESAVLFFLLDSAHVKALLGSSVRAPELRQRVRDYVIQLVPTLLGRRERKGS
ncbi:MAG: TetR/AcrR family transcriptional regulator [Candidatus Binatia bacterium]|nr:TetR/AcrR family transcriptional regulator [Candidatus Binatia bacterium]